MFICKTFIEMLTSMYIALDRCSLEKKFLLTTHLSQKVFFPLSLAPRLLKQTTRNMTMLKNRWATLNFPNQGRMKLNALCDMAALSNPTYICRVAVVDIGLLKPKNDLQVSYKNRDSKKRLRLGEER